MRAVCLTCREHLLGNTGSRAGKLPLGHIMHTHAEGAKLAKEVKQIPKKSRLFSVGPQSLAAA